MAEWNGAETGNRIARLAPTSLAASAAASTSAFEPEMTNWPPPLSLAIWQTPDPFAAAADGLYIGMLKANDRSHCAHADRHRCLHGIATNAQQACGISQRDATGGAQGRIFTQGVPGHKCRIRFKGQAAAFQRPHCCNRNRHECRLGIGGQGQGIFRAIEDDVGQFFTQGLIDFLENLSGLRITVVKGFAHSNLLAALAWKCECH